MRKIDKLIRKAKEILDTVVINTFGLSFNDDNFIEALGCDPKDYEVVLKDGTIMYDADRVLNDTAKEDWSDEES